MPSRATLTFETHSGIRDTDIIREIVKAMEEDEAYSGTADVHGTKITWDLVEPGEGVAIDRRQRLAAATLLMAFDLPQEMLAASRSMLEAARVCPDMTTGEIGALGPQSRIPLLEGVRALIDELLSEARQT